MDAENDTIAWHKDGFCTIRVYGEGAAHRESEKPKMHRFYYPGRFQSWGGDSYGDTSRAEFGG